jgi:hypothetical protein
MMKTQMDDSVIAKIREERHEVSRQHGHDPRKVVAYYMEMQKQYSDRLLESSATSTEHQTLVGGKTS